MTKAVDDDLLLREAARLFRQHGYTETTVRQIAKAARMLPGSLHYRYASKDDLLTALLDKSVERIVAELQKEIVKVSDPLERLRVGLGRYLELLLEGDDSLFVLLFDWRAIPPGAKAEIDKARGKLEDYWDRSSSPQAWATGRARPMIDLAAAASHRVSARATGQRPGTEKKTGARRARSPTPSSPTSRSACSTRSPDRRTSLPSSTASSQLPERKR